VLQLSALWGKATWARHVPSRTGTPFKGKWALWQREGRSASGVPSVFCGSRLQSRLAGAGPDSGAGSGRAGDEGKPYQPAAQYAAGADSKVGLQGVGRDSGAGSGRAGDEGKHYQPMDEGSGAVSPEGE
jgi:hypothetical protein